MNRIFCAAFQLYLVTLKYNNSTGIEVYEHFILQEAGYVRSHGYLIDLGPGLH
jgi:hypothetical protein